MKRRINILCMILTVITILETVALSATVFYGVLTKEVIQDLRNSADVMVESDAWQMVSDPANVHMENTPKHLRITLINPDGNAVCDSDADVRGMGNHKIVRRLHPHFQRERARRCVIHRHSAKVRFIMRYGWIMVMCCVSPRRSAV